MKVPRKEYTAEFKFLAVKRVHEGSTVGAVSKELGVEHPDAAQLGEGGGSGQAQRSGDEAGHARTDGALAVAGGERAAEAGD